MDIKPHVGHLEETMWPHLSVMVNNVALRLGLLPFGGGEETLEGDYGIIAQRLVSLGRSTLARGWWFNTMPLTLSIGGGSDGVVYYSIDTDLGHALDFKFDRFSENVPKDYALKGFVSPDGTTPGKPQLVIRDPEWDSSLTLEGYLTFIPRFGDEVWPQQFTDYLEAKVAEELSILFNVPPNRDETARCWHELIRVHADNRQPTNLIEQNPITWQTTRRR